MQSGQLRRREFITLVGGAAAVAAGGARAAAGDARGRILSVVDRLAGSDYPLVVAFRTGLAEAGYSENHNVAVEYRWPDGRYEQLPALALELVRWPVSVIVSAGRNARCAGSEEVNPPHSDRIQCRRRPGGDRPG